MRALAGSILIIDDDPDIVLAAEHFLHGAGMQTLSAASGEEGLRLLADESPAAVVLDLMLPGASGLEVLAEITAKEGHPPVVVLTSRNATEDVIRCMQLGARDYISKPFDGPRLTTSLRNVLRQRNLETRVERLVRELRDARGLERLLGESSPILEARALLKRATRSDVAVLLTGESGTGKEVAARAIHAESPRHAEPFVAVNCGAIPESLIESQLFGHERGAFTGADSAHAGFFEQADGGTLFLDEIGELRIDLQVKLLRVLQEGEIQRLGAARPRPLDVRVVSATNRDLLAASERGEFRRDLYYRLAVFPVCLPPLRDRGPDVLLLARHFLAELAARHGSPARSFARQAAQALQAYAWPGNVRELENVIERATILEDGELVGLGSLPDPVVEALDQPSPVPVTTAQEGLEGIERLEVHERRILRHALALTEWNVSEAAKRLGISRATLYRRIDSYQLRPDDAVSG